MPAARARVEEEVSVLNHTALCGPRAGDIRKRCARGCSRVRRLRGSVEFELNPQKTAAVMAAL